MTFHFPDEVDINVLTIEATDPKSGTAEFKAAAVRVEKIDRDVSGVRHCTRSRLLDADRRHEREAVDAVLGPPISTWAGLDRRRATATPPTAARAPRATCCCPRCTPCTTASAGSARARSTTSPAARRRRRRRSSAWRASTTSSPSSAAPCACVHVCVDIACRCTGSTCIATLDGAVGRTEPRSTAPAGASPCLGLCERAPAALVVEAGDEPLERDGDRRRRRVLLAALAARHPGGVSAVPPQAGRAVLLLLRRVGVVDPASLDDYRAHGGYDALRARSSSARTACSARWSTRKLVGRGGAAFPTGRKWEARGRASRGARSTSSATPTRASRARSRTGC